LDSSTWTLMLFVCGFKNFPPFLQSLFKISIVEIFDEWWPLEWWSIVFKPLEFRQLSVIDDEIVERNLWSFVKNGWIFKNTNCSFCYLDCKMNPSYLYWNKIMTQSFGILINIRFGVCGCNWLYDVQATLMWKNQWIDTWYLDLVQGGASSYLM